jgi:shikimate dehydrogenase
MKIGGKTKVTGIFGYPVQHTLSPAMHNAAFETLGLDYCYVPFSVHPDQLEDAVKAIRALNMRGVNITVPHKEKVMPFLDEVNDEASLIGAVNTLVNREGNLIGYNTDGMGFMESLAEVGISPEGKDAVIIGAGGAARAVSFSLAAQARTISIYGRTKEKVERLISDFWNIRKNILLLEDISDIGRFQMIVNATPLGLKEDDPLPFDASLLSPAQIVCDLIYKKTALLEEAERKGCITLDGSGMLLWQGAAAFELWTGKKLDIEIMRNALMRSC